MMASYVPGALRLQQGQTESLMSWTLHSIGRQTGKQTNEHTNHTKSLWRKSKSVINGDSDSEGWGWGQWSGTAFLRPWHLRSNVGQRGDWEDLGERCSQKSLEAKLSGASQGSGRGFVGLGTVRAWGALRSKGNCALGNRNQVWGAEEWSTKLLQILAGEDGWT